MSDYIKREDALNIIKSTSGDYAAAFSEVRKIPSADVVEVVRCKDCKHWTGKYCAMYYDRDIETGEEMGQARMFQNDYCSYGKRKENE